MSDIPNPRHDGEPDRFDADPDGMRLPPPAPAPLASDPTELPGRAGRMYRRRERIVAEVQRNRRGEHTVPTWVLAVLLAVIVGGWLFFVLTA
jgi:hypothetical protein